LEIEVLNAGITTKESLWRTLAIIQKHRPELVGLDVDELRQRARRQRKLLESYRGATAEEAFAAGS
jgi:hypothetical protein